ERSSMRRSLRATTSASRSTARHLAQRRVDGVTAGDGDRARRQPTGALELVAGDDDGAAALSGGAHLGVEHVATGGVETGVRLVEEPQLRIACEEDGERGAPPLAGRQP